MNPSAFEGFDRHKAAKVTREKIEDDCSSRCRVAFDKFQEEVRLAMQTRDWRLEQFERDYDRDTAD